MALVTLSRPRARRLPPGARHEVVVAIGPGDLPSLSLARIRASAALDRAVARARDLDAPLRIVAVADLPAGERIGDPEGPSHARVLVLRSVLDQLADDVGARAAGLDVEAELRPGPWADVLADEALSAAVLVVAVCDDGPTLRPPTAAPTVGVLWEDGPAAPPRAVVS